MSKLTDLEEQVLQSEGGPPLRAWFVVSVCKGPLRLPSQVETVLRQGAPVTLIPAASEPRDEYPYE